MDDHGAVQFVGSAITPLLGHDPLALIGSPVVSLVAESHAERLAALIQRAIGGREATDSDVPFLRIDGREVPLDLRISPLVEISGASAEGALLSLTESVTTGLLDLAMRGDERRLAALLPDAPLAVLRFDSRGECFAVNAAWCALTNREASMELGDGWLDRVHPTDAATLRRMLEESQGTGEGFRQDLDVLRGDGDLRKVEVAYAPVPNGGLLVAVDLTLPLPIAKRSAPVAAAALRTVSVQTPSGRGSQPTAQSAPTPFAASGAASVATPVAASGSVALLAAGLPIASPRRDDRGPLAAQPEASLQSALAAVLAASRQSLAPAEPTPIPVVIVSPVVVAPPAPAGKMSAFMAHRAAWEDAPRSTLDNLSELPPILELPLDADVVLQPPYMRQMELANEASPTLEITATARNASAVIEPTSLFAEPRSSILHAPDLRAPVSDRVQGPDESIGEAVDTERPFDLNFSAPAGIEPVSELVNTSEFLARVGAARERAVSQGMSLCVVRFELANYASKHKMYENTHMFILARRMVSCIRELDVAGRIGPAGFAVTGVGWFFPGDLERMIVRIHDRIKEDLPTTDDPVMPDFCIAGILGLPEDDDLTTMNKSQELLVEAFVKGPGHVVFDEVILGA